MSINSQKVKALISANSLTKELANEVERLESLLLTIARDCDIIEPEKLDSEECATACILKINWQKDLLEKAEDIIKARAQIPGGAKERIYLRNRKPK